MPTNPLNLAVGSPVWMFGRNDSPELFAISSETSRSWIVNDVKIPKSQTAPIYDYNPGFGSSQRYCLTRAAADALFLERQRWILSRRVQECADASVLKAVAAALGLPTGVDAKEGA